MADASRSQELSELEIATVKKMAAEKLGYCKKQYDVIGTQIFSILSLFARAIYYPLGSDAPWGFTHITGSRGAVLADKPFVAINTSIPSDCQVFAAAHELYHIWNYNAPDVVPSTVLNDVNNREELKANRFAAEFLVDEGLLLQELKLYKVALNRVAVRDVLKMAELFSVPYRTMAKRLYEIEIISKKTRDAFLSIPASDLTKLRKRYCLYEPEADGKIAIDNLVELAVDRYEEKKITYEKLEYLLSLSKLTPSDVGVRAPASGRFPTDEELDSIMEE